MKKHRKKINSKKLIRAKTNINEPPKKTKLKNNKTLSISKKVKGYNDRSSIIQ